MQLYRQKSQTIEAVQFDPDVQPWPDEVYALKDETDSTIYGYIQSSSGREFVRSGDWIVRGISGTLHVCNPHIFEATYEPVEIILNAPNYNTIYQNVIERINSDLRTKVGGNMHE